MSDFRKPRPDDPIVPQSALFRVAQKPFKRPKGRRGRKPKGQRVGKFVARQDPNFLIQKAQDEARKARELAIRRQEEDRELRQLQVQNIRDERVDRRRAEQARQDNLVIQRDRLRIEAAQGREVLRLRDRDQIRADQDLRFRQELAAFQTQETAEFRQGQIIAQQQDREDRAARDERNQAENHRIYQELMAIGERQERRQGENFQIMADFLRGERARGVRLDREILGGGGSDTDFSGQSIDFGPEGEREREATDLPRATARQRLERRRRRGGSRESERQSQDLIDRALSESDTPRIGEQVSFATDSSSSGEEQAPQRFQPRILRGEPDAPQRTGSFATDEEVSRHLRGQRRVAGSPAPQPEPEPSQQTARSPSPAVEDALSRAAIARRQSERMDDELGEAQSGDVLGALARGAGGNLAALGGGAARAVGGVALGVGQGLYQQLPAAQDVGVAVGRAGYAGVVAAGGLLQGALSPRQQRAEQEHVRRQEEGRDGP